MDVVELDKDIVKKSVMLACVIWAGSSPAWASCDREAASEFLSTVQQHASWRSVNDYIVVNWNFKTKVLPKEQRLDWISRFAEADQCLSGAATKIQFYHGGKLVGLFSPTTGVWRLE